MRRTLLFTGVTIVMLLSWFIFSAFTLSSDNLLLNLLPFVLIPFFFKGGNLIYKKLANKLHLSSPEKKRESWSGLLPIMRKKYRESLHQYGIDPVIVKGTFSILMMLPGIYTLVFTPDAEGDIYAIYFLIGFFGLVNVWRLVTGQYLQTGKRQFYNVCHNCFRRLGGHEYRQYLRVGYSICQNCGATITYPENY